MIKKILIPIFIIFTSLIAQGQIILTTTSSSGNWSPQLVTNTGATLTWAAAPNGDFGGQTENVNDPTFDFSTNVNSNPITITITSTGNDFSGLTHLAIVGEVFNVDDVLTDIDISEATALEFLNLSYNELSTIDISQNIELTEFIIRGNKQLLNQNLNTTANTKLEVINLERSGINNLDLSSNSLLVNIDLRNAFLPTEVLDQVLIDLDVNGQSGSNLPLLISGNAGQLSYHSFSEYNSLIGNGWTIDVPAPPSIPNPEEIILTTTSNIVDWKLGRFKNTGLTPHWKAEGPGIVTQKFDEQIPSFDFSANINRDPITITITSDDGFDFLVEMSLYIEGNNRVSDMTDIDISKAGNLKYLYPSNTNLNTINVDQNIELQRLMVHGISTQLINQINNKLDVTSNTKLYELWVENTHIQTLSSLLNNLLIRDIDLRNSQFTSAALDQVLIDLDQNGITNPDAPQFNEHIQIANNSGSLTSASYNAYNSLIAKNWMIDVPAPPAPPILEMTGNGNDILSGSTASTADGTDFADVAIGFPITHTFTITNSGAEDLVINSVTVTGATEFTPNLIPQTIAAGASVNYEVTFDPLAENPYNATIDIVSNDGGSPFQLNVAGNGVVGLPEIDVKGGTPPISIIGDGTNIPIIADDTDFGQVAIGTPVTHTFTIENLGNADLTINSAGLYNNTGGFSSSAIGGFPQFGGTISVGSSMTFDITFNPANVGVQTVLVGIVSDDSDEPNYAINITAEGISGSSGTIDVQGNGISIVNGDPTPDMADDTDFGQEVNNSTKINTYTIVNTGTTDLTITDIKFSYTSAVEFSISNPPTYPLTVVPGISNAVTFDVAFSPTSNGVYSAGVEITHSDGSTNNPFQFVISGEGVVAQNIMITQYYSGLSVDDKWIEVKNISSQNIPVGTYYLALFDNTLARTGVIETSNPTQNTAIPALLPGQVVLFRNGSVSLPSSGNIGTSDQVISDVCIFENGDDVILISTSNTTSCYNSRVDIIGNVSPSSGSSPNVWGDNSSFIKGGCSSEQAHLNFDINDWTFLNLPTVNVADPNTNIALGTQVVGSTEFDGTNWSNRPSDQSRTVIFTNSFTNASQTIEACNLIINQGVNIVFDSNGVTNNSIVVHGDFTNDGSLTIGDTESFVTIKDNAVLGAITKIDKTTPLNNYHDVTYWSSPVQSQQLFTVFAGVDPDRIFYYRGGDENPTYAGTIYKYWYKAVSGAMEAGRGYTSEALISTPIGGAFTVSFTGIPFNGTITKGGLWYSGTPDTGNANENFNLMGNPYPTAIDIRKFFSANGDVSDIALWNHDTPVDSNGNYVPADYLFYNSSGSSSPGVTFNIGSGQGFMARTIGYSGAVFKNTFKIKDANNQFYKTERSKKGYLLVDGDRDRIWLRLTSKSIGKKDDILIAFNKESTDDLDPRYDTYGGLGEKEIHLYSQIPDKDSKFVIQGLGDFEQSKTISVGFDSQISGSLSIGIAGLEGQLKGEEVYLVDHLLNITHDLKASDYQFEQTATGSFPDRFTLQFAGQALDVDDEIFAKNAFVISNDLDGFKIRSAQEVKDIKVYDLLGRMIIQKQPNKKLFSIQTTNIKNGTVLIIKATLENGSVISKKTIKY